MTPGELITDGPDHVLNAGRRTGRMIVARLSRHFIADQPARGLEIEHEDLRLQQRCRDVLALAGLLALQQRRENAKRSKQSGGEIGHRDAGEGLDDVVDPRGRRRRDLSQRSY